jgi:hypothetical protein
VNKVMIVLLVIASFSAGVSLGTVLTSPEKSIDPCAEGRQVEGCYPNPDVRVPDPRPGDTWGNHQEDSQ